ncbi:MAG: DUF1501 domain-containing protein [Vicinamibacterales bacterium]
MKFTRRSFVKGGVSAFTVGFAAPAFLSDVARAQGSSRRNLVVLYLSGGNDALSTLVPYTDPQYYGRRPTLAVPAESVLQVGTDSGGHALGLHPRLTDLRAIFNQGDLAIIQRTGYTNSTRSHFLGTDIYSTGKPGQPIGSGWLGRYLDMLPSPVDPLVGWATTREVPRSLIGDRTSVPAIQNPVQYAFASPNGGSDALYAREAITRIASHVPVDAPHLAFVNGTQQAALATLDRVATVAAYSPSVTYPNNGFGQALRSVAGAIVQGIGTKVFWVTTGGYDTHASQNTTTGAYANLMTTLNGGLGAFYDDLRNQGLLADTLVLQFSEFGRRISENGSAGTDHGAGGMMMAIGGGVRGGIYGTAADLAPGASNPTLENNSGDVRYETDFRTVYARVLDTWLGADSVPILGGDFRDGHQFI